MPTKQTRAEAVREALASRPSMNTEPRLSHEDVDRMISMFIDDPTLSYSELGRRFGVTPQTVRYHVQRAAEADGG